MNEQKEKPVTGASSNGTVIKPFLIEGGRFVVAVDTTEGKEHFMFSIRWEIDSRNVSEVLKTAEMFLQKCINDNEHLGNC